MKSQMFKRIFIASMLMSTLISATIPPQLIKVKAQTINYYFQSSWGGEADQLLNPQGIAWGKDSNIFVANQDLHRITVISTKDDTYRIWGYQGYNLPLEFQRTYDVAVDNDGNVYSTDGNWNITKTTPDGEYITSWYLGGAKSIATDDQGYIYVLRASLVSYDEHFVHIFTSDGAFVDSWGSAGTGLGNLNFPQGIAVDEMFVYIADTKSNRIQKFTHDGNFVASWGTQGNGVGQFFEPKGIAIDKNGNVYVADTRNHRIQIFTSNGIFLRKFGGSKGNNPGEFNYPIGISINDSGILLVSDSGNNRIQMFTNEGQYLRQFGSIKSYSSSNNFTGPIAVDSEHNIFIADNQTYMIQKFDKNMRLIQSWHSHFYGRIWGMAVDSGRYLYTTGGCKIQKYDLIGNWIQEWGDCTNGSPRSIAVDLDHKIYVNWWDSVTIKYDENGNFITSWTHPESQWISIAGITTDGGGNVYIADPNYSTIYQFTSNGSFIQKFGSFNGPTGLASYANIVYIADQFNNAVNVYESGGNYITGWGGLGAKPGEFVWPAEIATYRAQDIYVVDGNGLQKFSTTINPGVTNGSFEDSSSLGSWSYGGALGVSQSNTAIDGNFSLRLGEPVAQNEQGEGFSWAYQTIYVDPSLERPTLTFSYNIFTNDIIDYSDFFVQIQDGTGRNYLQTVVRDGFRPCEGSIAPPAGKSLGWRNASVDLSLYKGQYIRLVFANRNLWPGSWGIWTYVDDVKVIDAGPLPIPTGSAGIFLPLVTSGHCDPVPTSGISASPQIRNQP